MHICIITHEYPKPGFAHGGIGSFIKTFAPKLVQQGVKVTVIGLNYENHYENIIDEGVDVYRLNYKQIKGLSWYYGAKAISDKIKEVNKTVESITTIIHLGK